MEKRLSQLRVAVIATHGFEESELVEPVKALRDAAAQVDIVSLQSGEIQAFRHHDKSNLVKVNRTIQEIQPGEYQALLLPGGALNADTLRVNPKVLAFVKTMQEVNRPIAAICHAPWILVSAGIMQGRTLTSYESIRDDIRNAGGNWMDREVVVDGNWITSRKPIDLPAFNREMIRVFSHAAAASRSNNHFTAA